MPETNDAKRMYTERGEAYHRFVSLVAYPQGLRRFFLNYERLGPGLAILDAGCGGGILSFALHHALEERGAPAARFHGFDLTPAQLERFRARLAQRPIEGIELREANVLQLETLPESWKDYDLIVSSAMLEYIPRRELPAALAGLRKRLKPGGGFVLFISRTNWMMKLLIERWWDANLYTRAELAAAFDEAGFSRMRFRKFPAPFSHLNLWGLVVEADA